MGNKKGLISPQMTSQRSKSSSKINHPSRGPIISKLFNPPIDVHQSSDSSFHSIPDPWQIYPVDVNTDTYQSEINYDGLDFHQPAHHDSLIESFEPVEENLDLIDNQPDDLPSGEIKYADEINLEGEENLDINGDEELVLSNFHKTIDNSGNTWNYGNQYPVSDFSCSNKIYAGYYADVQANCQVWHLCEANGRHHSFPCPNGTLFNQLYRVCDWWYNVDCPKSREYYHINRDHGLINHNNQRYRYQPPKDYIQNGLSQLTLGPKTTDLDDY